MQLTLLIHDCTVERETGYSATCAEFPEANGQGESKEDCIQNLKSAVHRILEYRRDEALAKVSQGDATEVVSA